MKKLIFSFLMILFIHLQGQEQRLIKTDMVTGVRDTLDFPQFDTTAQSETTSFYTGDFNDEMNLLDESVPQENLYPDAAFTRKKPASMDYDIHKYPVRTSVTFFGRENDSLKQFCSGSMISPKHVLTALHCVMQPDNITFNADSILVCPVFDNGTFSEDFECAPVEKVYYFGDLSSSAKDIAILELETPVGQQTGWLSIGFETQEEELLDGIFYKFSYPGRYLPVIDSNFYNGDTLYYSYGLADWATDRYFGVENAFGIPGESGSSLIKIRNNEFYTTYGVFSYSHNLNHTRITRPAYYAIKQVIVNDVDVPEINQETTISIYPNPVEDVLNINLHKKYQIKKIEVFDVYGNKLHLRKSPGMETTLNLSNKPDGLYIVVIETGKEKIVRKIIKQSSSQ